MHLNYYSVATFEKDFSGCIVTERPDLDTVFCFVSKLGWEWELLGGLQSPISICLKTHKITAMKSVVWFWNFLHWVLFKMWKKEKCFYQRTPTHFSTLKMEARVTNVPVLVGLFLENLLWTFCWQRWLLSQYREITYVLGYLVLSEKSSTLCQVARLWPEKHSVQE